MKKINVRWFTLIEVIVAVTILSIIMISVFNVFFLASNLSNKTDASRIMQENIKNLVEIISEDIRQNEILWVNSDIVIWACTGFISVNNYIKWTKLCVWSNEYYLASYNWSVWVRKESCNLWENCSIVRKNWSNIDPITNSFITFNYLNFYYTNDNIPKVTIIFESQPATWKWLKPELIKENKIIFQTTFSKRLY